ncbi:ImmA/IrrE family metallo-endopeptidase [Paenibacillus alvei]|uniref:ImmA/IrrE family metallo-endopeptidase n=1 Tax=Paenibacillus alvei TaxID=44250 RepID=A0ABT4GXQ0_PAEAL|nr:ImmA/IrrE family metallo-endopeptidase [Paenibacillus alvei]MCY9734679.1 ImmA/IrrE family metallo-endopeptidase [Paenibacillus alvei]MCY9758847.1 ImmA/IrrE family metallo-endopeptidase [Paenibacillus alvei]MCY9761196.1 ImmA/IrrE family metallo-endopeptidase [Paenibacillus alvei]MCY9765760.1 ImmA/IrrE family metallo-endopeptidase [Paenibacillus alvei]NEZ40312.1 ImmA/IrrE family metallo-endopeptidase [Paenibacillus alvei]
MIEHYQMTRIEEFTERLYKRIGISNTYELTIEEIASRLNIWIYYTPIRSKALEVRPGMFSMNIDSRLQPREQWVEFLHELCHLLRHAGNQTIMPEEFTKAQEAEADAFAMYAAMPISMIKTMTLPERCCDAAACLSEEFQVPIDMAQQRLEQIRRRVYAGRFFAAVSDQGNSSIVKEGIQLAY